MVFNGVIDFIVVVEVGVVQIDFKGKGKSVEQLVDDIFMVEDDDDDDDEEEVEEVCFFFVVI